MSLQLRRGSRLALQGITPDAGEPIVTLDGPQAGLHIGDGVTQGGIDVSGDMRKSDYDSLGDGVVNAARSVPWAGVTDKPLDGFPAAPHTHAIEDVAGLASALAAAGGGGPHTHPISEVTGLQAALDAKAAFAHTHAVSDVSGLQAALDAKAAVGHTHAWADVTGKPSSFTPASHTHAISDVSGLQAALDAAGAAVHRNLGGTGGTVALDMEQARNFTASLTLSSNATLNPTNVPSGVLASLVLVVKQPAGGGRTLAFPPNTSFVGAKSIDTAANAVNVVTLLTADGGASYLAAVSDTRPPRLDPILINPDDDGAYYFAYDFPITVELGQALARGTGSAAYARAPSGSNTFTSVSSGASLSLAAGDVLRVTVTGVGAWYTLTLPRSA